MRYIMYVASREQKKRGGKRDSSDNSKDKFKYHVYEYERIFSKVAALSSPDAYPVKSKQRIVSIGCNDILSSKAAILQQWYEQ